MSFLHFDVRQTKKGCNICCHISAFHPLEQWACVSTSIWINCINDWRPASLASRVVFSLPISCGRAQLVGGSLISPHAS